MIERVLLVQYAQEYNPSEKETRPKADTLQKIIA
jgi:hypothetical protein